MREARVGPVVIVKPEIRSRSLVAVFAGDVVVEVAVRFEFKMNSNRVDVRWFGVVVRKRGREERVGSDVECVRDISGVAIYFVEFYQDGLVSLCV